MSEATIGTPAAIASHIVTGVPSVFGTETTTSARRWWAAMSG
jgi:hypothetical protein